MALGDPGPGAGAAAGAARPPGRTAVTAVVDDTAAGTERAVRTAGWALGVLADPARRPPAVLHPLGFLCFPLLRAPGVGVCVHVWLPGRAEFAPPLATTPVHAHSWDLLSYVLLGRIGNELVETEPAEPPAATHRVYEIRSERGADRVVPTARCVRCRGKGIRYAGPGEVYRLAGGEFHASVVDEGEAVATVLLADSRGGRDRALGPLRPAGEPGRVPRREAPGALGAFAARTVLDRATLSSAASRPRAAPGTGAAPPSSPLPPL
jgi:hypothetical protein